MTLIVGFTHSGTAYLAADRHSYNDTGHAALARPKIFRAHGLLWGFAGSFRVAQIIEHMEAVCTTPVNTDPYSWIVRTLVPAMQEALETGRHVISTDNDLNGFSAMIATRQQLFSLYDDWAVNELASPCVAMGAAEEHAAGAASALYPDLGTRYTPEAYAERVFEVVAQWSNQTGPLADCEHL